jgi:shikimate dehydrogenase
MNEGQTKYFAVFGNPVLHSRSPQLYNAQFLQDGINAVYTRIHVPSGRAVCEIIRMLGLSGANITTPFKEEVVPWLDDLSPDARQIAAVNTIINLGGLLTGYNTDASGITGSLLEAGIDPSGMNCLVLGAGGAGKAAAMGLLSSGASVTIANRSVEKAAGFAHAAGCSFDDIDHAVKNINTFNILVLALPPGVFPFDSDRISPDMTIVDANYRSPKKNHGIEKLKSRVIKGDRWLLHQGVAAYKLFTGHAAKTSVMEDGLKRDPDPGKLIIRTIKDKEYDVLKYPFADLLVDGRGFDELQVNMIIDEERAKAFGSKR